MKITDEMIERGARALCIARRSLDDSPNTMLTVNEYVEGRFGGWTKYAVEAKAVLQAGCGQL